MTLSPDLERMFQDTARRRAEEAKRASEEHFAQSDSVWDLEFLPPDCSICGMPTEFDDGWFSCSVCCCSWPRSGMNGKRWPQEDR